MLVLAQLCKKETVSQGLLSAFGYPACKPATFQEMRTTGEPDCAAHIAR